MSAGIDYGMGQTNIDKETGIRYGVISQHEVTQAWCDSSEADYGEPSCPECGNEAQGIDGAEQDYVEKNGEDAELTGLHSWSCADYGCASCGHYFGSDEAFGDEPLGFNLDDGEYKATCGQDGDIFILKSPYFTRAAFCSPCAPGACYLTDPREDGERAYCFGHDWFEDGKAPYPVYSVKTGDIVNP